MSEFICYTSEDGISLPCLKVRSGANPINCKGCRFEQKHKEHLDEIDNNQKGD